MTPVFPVVGAYTAAFLVLLGVILTVRVIVGRVRFGVESAMAGTRRWHKRFERTGTSRNKPRSRS